jgi:hypothetical protein
LHPKADTAVRVLWGRPYFRGTPAPGISITAADCAVSNRVLQVLPHPVFFTPQPRSATINATLYEKLNYNFIRDIAPIASIVRLAYVRCCPIAAVSAPVATGTSAADVATRDVNWLAASLSAI